ncbi:unnamed protein product [Psylliodes chrysocephalus]|uniref:Aquaporin n=1 Tax=Psylliodes chrysocephalus TaxID=3402493 RepID=A0A9P0CJ48_9CUCU|nr:unnamed protein product [Psylliodes chrysocephala]
MGDEGGEYPPYIISFFTEVVGTAIMMYIGCMGCIRYPDLGPIVPSFSFGLSILAVIQTFHHIGPVHLNPAVSIGFLIVSKIAWQYFLVYLAGQFIGAFVGYGALFLLTPEMENMCLLKNKLGLNVVQCFLNEVLCSMVLMLLILGAVDEKNKDFKDSIALRIAMGVTGIIFALEPFTGAGLNPARSVPPAVFFLNFENLWQYMLGPAAGMAIGAVLYRFFFDGGEAHSLHTFLRSKE